MLGVLALALITTVGAGVEPQPFQASVARLDEALQYLGSPLAPALHAPLQGLLSQPPGDENAAAIQQLLDPLCLAHVHINPEARVKSRRGDAPAVLQQGGWASFLVKVENEGAVRAELRCDSPNALPALHRSSGEPTPKKENLIEESALQQRFLEVAFYKGRPLEAALSGVGVEYKVLQIYTTAGEPREAALHFHIGEGTRDLGHRNALHVLFKVKSAVKLVFDVQDTDGGDTMASFIIRDYVERVGDIADAWTMPGDYRHALAMREHWSRPGIRAHPPLTGIYPLPARRIADRDTYPDFFFQPQVYRRSGEHVLLPAGSYEVTWTRGPEYLPQTRVITIPPGADEHRETFKLQRWIDMTPLGWYSADHHVHAGGCSHYESPEAGVKPEAMLRQAQGEDLDVACVLTWGPCWYHQKSFFEGKVHALSTPETLVRYDVEVSGFPSSHAGHVCLLRLKEDDYPGTEKIEEWPSYTLPVMQWAKSQGGVAGYAHSGWGLEPTQPTEDLPNLVMPKMDGIGANEYIVTVTHGACDFISAGDTPLNWELNIWYHTLNCGYRTVISGETDYPCIFDERVGLIRTYAPLEGPLDFDAFVEPLKLGNSYVSDGRSHIVDFTAGTAALVGNHEAAAASGDTLRISARVAAWLPEKQDDAGKMIRDGGMAGRPYWHVEKSRIEDSRRVPVELVVNGIPVATQEIDADGVWRDVTFDHAFDRSSWVALRVLYSSHTNPLYVLVDGKPVRASRSSAQWCRDAVDKCWDMKAPRIRAEEMAAARAAYDHARAAYDQVLAEAADDPANMQYGLPEGTPKEAKIIAVDSPAVLASMGWEIIKRPKGSRDFAAMRAAKGPGNERIRWQFDNIPRGRYEVLVWVPKDPAGSRAPVAQYRLSAKRDEQEIALPQPHDSGGWQSLGLHTLRAGDHLELVNGEEGTAVASAVALVAK